MNILSKRKKWYGVYVAELTVSLARKMVRKRMVKGCDCPVCGQTVRVYKILLNKGMVGSLIEFGRYRGEYVHAPTVLSKGAINSRSYPKLVHWGLVVSKINEDEKKKDSGYWRITRKGRSFLRGKIFLPKYVFLYNNKVCKVSNEEVDIEEALGVSFDYRSIFIK
jgi:hypothetical protein